MFVADTSHAIRPLFLMKSWTTIFKRNSVKTEKVEMGSEATSYPAFYPDECALTTTITTIDLLPRIALEKYEGVIPRQFPWQDKPEETSAWCISVGWLFWDLTIPVR